MTNVRFVQFPHPGREHRPSSDGRGKTWNWLKNPSGTDNPHARTFFQTNGIRLVDNAPIAGLLWAWGEWEAEARVIRCLDGAGGRPTTLFEPYWVRKNSFKNLHNTDPFVFGGFYYTDCKQGTAPALQGMLELDVGSVIVFGSGLEKQWVVDTIFVIREYVDHDVENYTSRLYGKVPEGYDQLVLGPTYGEHAAKRSLPRRLYIGATYNTPVNQMFSFFPCIAPGINRGFARPEIRLSSILTPDQFNPKLRQGMKGHKRANRSLASTEVSALWREVRAQVEAQGCALGVWADMPKPLK